MKLEISIIRKGQLLETGLSIVRVNFASNVSISHPKPDQATNPAQFRNRIASEHDELSTVGNRCLERIVIKYSSAECHPYDFPKLCSASRCADANNSWRLQILSHGVFDWKYVI